MITLSKQRNDVTQSEEDFGRIMEDYFAIIPPKIEAFQLKFVKLWTYDDLENTMTFSFENELALNDFLDEFEKLPECYIFEYNEYEHLDRQNLTMTIIGKDGGLK